MPTILEYLTDRLHLSPERADAHLRSEFVRVHSKDGGMESVTDGGRELGADETVTLQPPAGTEHV